MSDIFDQLLISSPNNGGLFLISNGGVLQLDGLNTTGLSSMNGVFLRGLQPSSIWVSGKNTFGVMNEAVAFDDIHDVLFYENSIYVVGTEKNEIIKLNQNGLEEKRWIVDGNDDSCHINCLGVWNDRIVFSAFGDFCETRGYKGKSAGAGYVQDLLSGKRLIEGLSQPHSLVSCGQNLLVANSEEMEVREYSVSGGLIRTLKLDRYTRGICLSNDIVYVGLSNSRNKSVEEGSNNTATLVALEHDSWDELGRLSIPASEIYSVLLINDVRELLDVIASVASYTSVKYESLVASLNLNVTELDAGVARLNHVVAERDAAEAERDTAVAEHDAVLVAINGLKTSRSWRITSPLRFFVRLVRHGFLDEDKQRISRAVRKRYHLLPLPVAVKKFISLIYYRGVIRFVRAIKRRLFRVGAFYAPSIFPVEQHIGLPDYIVWGVVDWRFRHQRPQQLALALASAGHRVFYISPDLQDDERAGFNVEALDDSGLLFQINLFVKDAPQIYTSVPGLETVAQLRSSIGEVLDWASVQQVVSLVQHPFWFDAASVLPNSRLVYDCMDHHEGFSNTIDEMVQLEKSLLMQADLTVTTSDWLDQAVEPHVRRRALIRNAADYEYFSREPENIYSDTQGRRIIGYYGAIAEWFDLDLVESIAKQYPECCVLLIGADTVNARGRLDKLPNVTFTGEVPYNKIPYYLYSFDICLLPFKVIPLTIATNPVKVYEYLSAGKPVVAVDLPEMSQFDGLVNIAADKEHFLAEVNSLLMQAETSSMILNRKKFAAGQTWAHRTDALIEQVESTTNDPMVSVVVVTYNNLELTRACLDSLNEYCQYANLEIIVVDNASSDTSPEFLKEWASHSHNRRLILNDDNRGFAAANNQGLKIASGDYLVMLNNDTYVTPGWIRTLFQHLQRDKTIGLIGPVTNNIGNEAKIDIAYNNMSEMLTESAAYTNRHVGQLYPLRTAAFFCVMMSQDTYQNVGPLDEAFGRGFFEDDDYCRRIEVLGQRIACAEDVFVHHQLSASFNKLGDKKKKELFDKNKAVYEKKWGEWLPHRQR